MILCTSDIAFGQPILKGRRLTVYDIVTKIGVEKSLEAAIDDYGISLSDASDAVNYCSSQKCKADVDLIHFCDGCLLRTLAEGDDFERSKYVEVKDEDSSTFSKSNNDESIFLGSLDELERESKGIETWLIAREMIATYPSLENVV